MLDMQLSYTVARDVCWDGSTCGQAYPGCSLQRLRSRHSAFSRSAISWLRAATSTLFFRFCLPSFFKLMPSALYLEALARTMPLGIPVLSATSWAVADVCQARTKSSGETPYAVRCCPPATSLR